jgi:hypothetical protein
MSYQFVSQSYDCKGGSAQFSQSTFHISIFCSKFAVPLYSNVLFGSLLLMSVGKGQGRTKPLPMLQAVGYQAHSSAWMQYRKWNMHRRRRRKALANVAGGAAVCCSVLCRCRVGGLETQGRSKRYLDTAQSAATGARRWLHAAACRQYCAQRKGTSGWGRRAQQLQQAVTYSVPLECSSHCPPILACCQHSKGL